MNECETTPHPPSKRLAPNHHPTESVEEANQNTTDSRYKGMLARLPDLSCQVLTQKR